MDSVVGSGRTVGAAVTRPADTSAYTAGDVISDSTSAPTLLTFQGVGGSARGFTILQSVLCIDSANQATKPDLELWLFDTAPAAQNDNAAFAPTDAELITGLNGLVGVIPIPSTSFRVGLATSGAAGNSICHVTNIGLPLNLNAFAVLYALVVVRNAYTPVSAEAFTFKLALLD